MYEQLKQDLLGGRYGAGTTLAVTNLREEYAVSKQPVMEALRALAADRLVQIHPQVGVRVSQFSADEVAAFFSMFARTEGAMAHRAATRRTEAQLSDLEAQCVRLEALESVGEEDRNPGYLQGNREVHRLIHVMARSDLAADISADLWDLSDFLIATHGDGFAGHLPERNAGHREVLTALRAKDPVAAEDAMSRHILSSPLSGIDVERTARTERSL